MSITETSAKIGEMHNHQPCNHPIEFTNSFVPITLADRDFYDEFASFLI